MPENNSNTPSMNDPIWKKWQEKSAGELFIEFRDFLEDLVDLREGMDQKGTIENILNNKRMKGANAWLLMCSIMVASLGLDLNSPAVIIGAMLISPLMSPILGIGLGVGINDRNTLFISLQHFFIAIVIALITSYLYFKFITPFGEFTNEIESRTKPTLLDGLVAIFGGTAGVISTTRKDKSNAIPGVAIATALMPPLCVAGYGLAEGNLIFFRDAFYLFFLNSFFIAASTYLVIRVLRFRYKQYPSEKERKRNQFFTALFSILILIPAVILLTSKINDFKEDQNIKKIIYEHFENDFTAVADHEKNDRDTVLQIDIQLIGEPVSQDEILACDKLLDEKLGKEVKIVTYQSEEIPFDDIQKLKKDIGGFQGEFATKIANLEKIQQEREVKIDQLNRELDSIQNNVILKEIFAETKINYPLIDQIGFAKEFKQTNFTIQEESPVLLVKWNRKKTPSTRLVDQEKLKDFMQLRAKLDTLILIAY